MKAISKLFLCVSMLFVLVRVDAGFPAWGGYGGNQGNASARQASAANRNSEEKSVEKILEEKGEYSLAAEMMRDNIKDEFTLSGCNELYNFNERMLARLSPSIIQKTVSSFEPPPKDSFSMKDYAIMGGSSILGGWGAAGVAAAEINRRASNRQREAVQAMSRSLPDKEAVQKIMDNYDVVKDNVLFLEKTLKNEIKRSEDTGAPLDLLKKVRAQKKQLGEDRTNYLSYNVISPVLWEANRLLFLADSDYLSFKGKDKAALDNAVKTLAKACHKDWLYQASEDVRMQFVETQRKLKDIASSTELEDYKVVTTLTDCIDSTKERGVDAWLK